ncbi:MAG: delta-aminolevulinic acid dehydratase [Verrucomicrobiia bacterium Tous-C3TDCM]|nr:MAG: delta-aminolevulinic acid dehydratase [Verrucomicrobiae bacterium Tous-C3TDCM]
MQLPIRPRRNRKSAAIRALVRETVLSPGDFIQPLFLQEGTQNDAIASMPGVTRWCEADVVREACQIFAAGVPAVVLFPKIDDALKTSDAAECYHDQGLIPRVIRAIKSACPQLCVITDIALDPYNADGHDGLVRAQANGEMVILNDETVEILCRQALCHAAAGADIVSPSDMMDGRVAALRDALDHAGHEQVSILSYSAKYASAYYGPFRGALDSAPKAGDKKTYQMDYANAREAVREILLDEQEGADMIMVKPAGAYLDIIAKVREQSTLPVAAYQVSGEYLMIESAAAAGWLDRKAIILESLTAIKRAGADIILTYYAKEVAKWLRDS